MLARSLRRIAAPAAATAGAARTFSAAAVMREATAAKPRVLVTGAIGQIGMELVDLMRLRYGNSSVVASDVRCSSALRELGPFAYLDVTNQEAIAKLVVVSLLSLCTSGFKLWSHKRPGAFEGPRLVC